MVDLGVIALQAVPVADHKGICMVITLHLGAALSVQKGCRPCRLLVERDLHQDVCKFHNGDARIWHTTALTKTRCM
jgi:hypothetical protein